MFSCFSSQSSFSSSPYGSLVSAPMRLVTKRGIRETDWSKQITNGAGHYHDTKATIDGLQEKAKTAEVRHHPSSSFLSLISISHASQLPVWNKTKMLKPQLKVAKLSDQLRHVRLQNDALRIQVEETTGQASLFFPSTHTPSNQNKTRGRSQGQSQSKLVQAPPTSSILQLGHSLKTPKTAITQILGFMSQNIHYIFEHLPPFIKSLIEIYKSFTTYSTTTRTKKLESEAGAIQGVSYEESKADVSRMIWFMH